MTSTPARRLFPLFAVALATAAAEIPEADLGAYRRPAADQGGSFAAEEAQGVVAEIAKTGSFAKWKTFEDERVKFLYPDHEAVTVEVKIDEPVPVDGDRVSDVDTSFSRAYRLTAGGETLTVLMLKDGAEWFDDGVCFCGEIVYDRYLVRDGRFYRFGFLESGVMKKMEVLGDRERLMMFEWTHSPIHPEVYRKIARSVELKRPGKWQENECRKRVMADYGPEGAVGCFGEGAAVGDVVALIGAPTTTREDGARVWEYPKEEDGFRWTERLTLPFAAGKLARFDGEYYDSAWNSREAIPGGLPWMKSQAEPYEDPPVRGEEAKAMPDALKVELLRLFLQKAEDPEEDFNGLCQVMKILVEQGVRDPKALEIVRKRFAADGDHYAAWVLHEAGQPEDVTLFVDKIRAAYRDGEGGALSDLHNWLAFVPDEDPRYPDLLRDGLKSRSGSVRDSAYFFLGSAPFPEEERLAFVRQGLRDPEKGVRYWSARVFAKREMSDAGWKLLEEAAGREQDETTRKDMLEVLSKREGKGGD